MANYNIVDLGAIANIIDTTIFECQDGGVNYKFTGLQLKAYLSSVVTLPAGIQIDCGTCDLSSNLLPTTGGTGAGGALKKGNFFRNTVSSTTLHTADGASIPPGVKCTALVDTPGQTISNWSFEYLII